MGPFHEELSTLNAPKNGTIPVKEMISKLCYNYLYLGHGLYNVIMALFDVHQTLRKSNEIQKFDT